MSDRYWAESLRQETQVLGKISQLLDRGKTLNQLLLGLEVANLKASSLPDSGYIVTKKQLPVLLRELQLDQELR